MIGLKHSSGYANKGQSLVEYDLFGHPRRIQHYNGNFTEYVYAATGEKLRVKHTTAVEGLTVPLGQTLELTAAQTMDVDSVDYWGSLRITKSHVGLNHGAVGLKYQFGGGYFALTPEPAQTGVQYVPTFHYYVNDYQGNVRLVVDGNGTVEQRNDYYAYGGPWGDNAATQGFQPNKYNGKELDRMHGLDWYDYGARMYDPAMGLFTQIDPLAVPKGCSVLISIRQKISVYVHKFHLHQTRCIALFFCVLSVHFAHFEVSPKFHLSALTRAFRHHYS